MDRPLSINSKSSHEYNCHNSEYNKKIKLSKRVNARLQLAAALIEADNEEAERKRNIQREDEGGPLSGTSNSVALLPRLKLASESVIFAPYRGHGQLTEGSHGLRSGQGSGLDSEGRPVMDFLGVKLPAEKRYERQMGMSAEGMVSSSSRPITFRTSSDWPSRPLSVAESTATAPSRPMSAASKIINQNNTVTLDEEQETEEAALSEWGVEKFLSSEARERIKTGRRSRANSTIERPQSVMSDSPIDKAHSEIGTEASALPSGNLSISKLDLMARIKKYREGQKEANGQNEECEASDAVASQALFYSSLSDSRLRGHLEAITRAEGSSLGEVCQERNTILGRDSVGLERTNSNTGIFGDSWSEQGNETIEPSFSLTHLSKKLSGVLEDRGNEDDVPERGESVPIEITHPIRICSPVEEYERHADGMAGIGSFSRSPNSRRHSLASNSHLLGPPFVTEGESKSPRCGGDLARSLDELAHRSNDVQEHKASESRGMKEPMSPRSTAYCSISSGTRIPSRTTSPRPLSMLNPAFSPRLKPSPNALIASLDPFFDMESTRLGPYPKFGGPASRSMEQLDIALESLLPPDTSRRKSEGYRASMHDLSTRQLQELAKQNSFPASYGMSSGYTFNENGKLIGGEDESHHAEDNNKFETEFATLSKVKQEGEITAKQENETAVRTEGDEESEEMTDLHKKDEVLEKRQNEFIAGLDDVNGKLMEDFICTTEEVNQSSTKKGRKKRKSILTSKFMNRKSLHSTSQAESQIDHQSGVINDDIDDDYTSPPTQGPLRPLGVENRLPSKLKMPQPLEGTSLAPRRKLVVERRLSTGATENKQKPRIPEGFVLHNRTETVSMKALNLQGGSETKLFFTSPMGKSKHDRLVSDMLQFQTSQRFLPIPSAAPPGIGRRAAMKSTVLFRNQLVQHDEEKEGWGWEAGSCIGTELMKETEDEQKENEGHLLKKRTTGQEVKMEKKQRKDRQKRKEERRTRRRKRELARTRNLSMEELNVEEFSPDEDLDLSETSSSEQDSISEESDMSWNSEDVARWVDEKKPAGRLYGKSLLDVMDERKKKVTSKARQYGQTTPEDFLVDGRSIVATSVGGAPSFRDNPVGFNDTRERMEAAFGQDTLWAREVAQRKLEEAQEAEEAEIKQAALAELEAEDAAKKSAKKMKKKKGGNSNASKDVEEEDAVAVVGHAATELVVEEVTRGQDESEICPTPSKPPTINLTLPQDSHLSHKPSSLSGAAAQWLDSDDEDDASSDDSEALAERRKQALQRARMSRSLGGLGQKALEVSEEDSDDSNEEDNVPLSTLRSKLPTPTFASRLGVKKVHDDSEEENLSLAQLVAKRKQETQNMGLLNLQFMTEDDASPQGERQLSDDEDDLPIGIKLANLQSTLQSLVAHHGNQDGKEDDDDRPLGIAHPQAAIIAEQANRIKELQLALIIKQQQQQQQQMIMSASCGFLPPNTVHLPSTPFMTPFQTRPMSTTTMPPYMMMPLANPQQGASIVDWASQVPPDQIATTGEATM